MSARAEASAPRERSATCLRACQGRRVVRVSESGVRGRSPRINIGGGGSRS
jgi:hypothetical protein